MEILIISIDSERIQLRICAKNAFVGWLAKNATTRSKNTQVHYVHVEFEVNIKIGSANKGRVGFVGESNIQGFLRYYYHSHFLQFPMLQ